MQIYLVYFESANYAGYGHRCVVKAQSEDEAEYLAKGHAEDVYYDEDSDQWYDENEDDPCEWAAILTVEEFGPEHDTWQYFMDKTQREHFYPCIGFEFGDIAK